MPLHNNLDHLQTSKLRQKIALSDTLFLILFLHDCSFFRLNIYSVTAWVIHVDYILSGWHPTTYQKVSEKQLY